MFDIEKKRDLFGRQTQARKKEILTNTLSALRDVDPFFSDLYDALHLVSSPSTIYCESLYNTVLAYISSLQETQKNQEKNRLKDIEDIMLSLSQREEEYERKNGRSEDVLRKILV